MGFNLNLRLEHLINARASQHLPLNCSGSHQIQLEVVALQKMEVPVPITVTKEKTTQTWLSNTTLSMQWRKTRSEIVQANLSTSLASTAARMSHLTTMQTCKTTKKQSRSHKHTNGDFERNYCLTWYKSTVEHHFLSLCACNTVNQLAHMFTHSFILSVVRCVCIHPQKNWMWELSLRSWNCKQRPHCLAPEMHIQELQSHGNA